MHLPPFPHPPPKTHLMCSDSNTQVLLIVLWHAVLFHTWVLRMWLPSFSPLRMHLAESYFFLKFLSGVPICRRPPLTMPSEGNHVHPASRTYYYHACTLLYSSVVCTPKLKEEMWSQLSVIQLDGKDIVRTPWAGLPIWCTCIFGGSLCWSWAPSSSTDRLQSPLVSCPFSCYPIFLLSS